MWLVRSLCILCQQLATRKHGWNPMKVALSYELCLLQCLTVCFYTVVFLQIRLSSLGTIEAANTIAVREGWRENCKWSLKKCFLLPSLNLHCKWKDFFLDFFFPFVIDNVDYYSFCQKFLSSGGLFSCFPQSFPNWTNAAQHR